MTRKRKDNERNWIDSIAIWVILGLGAWSVFKGSTPSKRKVSTEEEYQQYLTEMRQLIIDSQAKGHSVEEIQRAIRIASQEAGLSLEMQNRLFRDVGWSDVTSIPAEKPMVSPLSVASSSPTSPDLQTHIAAYIQLLSDWGKRNYFSNGVIREEDKEAARQWIDENVNSNSPDFDPWKPTVRQQVRQNLGLSGYSISGRSSFSNRAKFAQHPGFMRR